MQRLILLVDSWMDGVIWRNGVTQMGKNGMWKILRLGKVTGPFWGWPWDWTGFQCYHVNGCLGPTACQVLMVLLARLSLRGQGNQTGLSGGPTATKQSRNSSCGDTIKRADKSPLIPCTYSTRMNSFFLPGFSFDRAASYHYLDSAEYCGSN